MKKQFLFLNIVLCGYFHIVKAQQKPVYKDKSASIERRVQDLLSRMTLEEKFGQICIWRPDTTKFAYGKSPELIIAQMGDPIKNGIGFIQYDQNPHPVDFAKYQNAIQKFLITKTRLGIPMISNSEASHGFVGRGATVFPVPLSLASSWDTTLVENVFNVCAFEMRSYGVTHAATPVIDLLREPRFGRADEMFSEDPYLTGAMGVAAIFGLQGRGPQIDGHHLIACAKHFAGHGQPEAGTNMAPANFSERVLRENHLYPFEMAVKKANVRTVMASYNEIDGVPDHQNSWLLNTVLKNEWGFKGYVISDWDAINRMITVQHVCVDQSDAGKKAFEAGVDFELPNTDSKDYCFQHIPELIKSGQIKMSVLDSAVARIIRNKFIMGLFDQPYILDAEKTEKLMNSEESKKLALRSAEESIILLKNDQNVLPYQVQKIKSLAVIGPNADEVHYGSYSQTSTPGVSILQGLKNYAKGRFNIAYAEGFKIYQNDTTIAAKDKTIAAEEKRIADAVKLAAQSDEVLLVLGGNELTCREGWAEDHTGDVDDLNLLGRQDDLVKAVLATGKKVTVLLINGRPLSINYVAQNVPAILEGWYLGQEQGNAVANILFGNVNPSGKLTVTIPRSVGQLPVYYNHKPLMHERSLITGPYSPLYHFGFGLSYTKFNYNHISTSAQKIRLGENVKVTVEVTNSGDRDGDEVVQLYIRDVVSSVTRPVQELKDFQRVSLKKGETKTVSFTITPDKLQFYDINMKRVVEPGEFEIQIGKNSADYLTAKFEIVK